MKRGDKLLSKLVLDWCGFRNKSWMCNHGCTMCCFRINPPLLCVILSMLGCWPLQHIVCSSMPASCPIKTPLTIYCMYKYALNLPVWICFVWWYYCDRVTCSKKIIPYIFLLHIYQNFWYRSHCNYVSCNWNFILTWGEGGGGITLKM